MHDWLRHEIVFPFAQRTAFIVPMKEVKPKTRGKTKGRPIRKDPRGDTPYSKPVLRSDAFVKALTDAKACLKNPEDLQVLFNEAATKAAAVPTETITEYWPYLQTM